MKMMSPRLSSILASWVTSPRSRITITPAIDTRMPSAWVSVSRTPRMISDHSATNSGAVDCSSRMLSAVVDSSAVYCSVLKIEMPLIEIASIKGSRRRISRQSWRR